LEIAIDLRESSDNTIYGNTYTGIWIYDSNTQQYYPSGLFGIYLENSNRNKLLNNEIEGTRSGIKLYSSTENIIFRNKLKGNINGTTVIDSINNMFYLNDFVNNTVNTYSKNSTNIWNSTTVIAYTYNNSMFIGYLGNYWDDFSGVDSDGNGVIDEPYLIDENNADFHPLKQPLDNYVIKITKGDFNYDGFVDVNDVSYVAYMIVGKIKPDIRADFNKNGRIDIGDLAKIAYYLVGKIREI